MGWGWGCGWGWTFHPPNFSSHGARYAYCPQNLRLSYHSAQGYFLSNFQGGTFEILDLFLKQISDLLKKLWTFQYAAGFRGPGISQNIQKIFKKYPKIDYRAFASSRLHYAADNRTARDIQNIGPFWVVKIQGGGQCPPGPPDKNIPAAYQHVWPPPPPPPNKEKIAPACI